MMASANPTTPRPKTEAAEVMLSHMFEVLICKMPLSEKLRTETSRLLILVPFHYFYLRQGD